ncbi:hypothetical protein MASR1M42_14730 [Azonexus hydrophilus]
MISVILAFACGVFFLQTCASLPPLWLVLAGALGCLLLSHFCWRRARSLVLVCAAFLLGVSWAGWRAELRLQDALDAQWEGRDVVVQGVVAGLPQPGMRAVRFEFLVEAVLTPGARLPQRVLLNWYAAPGSGAGAPAIAPGERWRLTVRLKKPHGSANPGGFDYEMWLFERGIRATGYVRPPGERAWMVSCRVSGVGWSVCVRPCARVSVVPCRLPSGRGPAS